MYQELDAQLQEANEKFQEHQDEIQYRSDCSAILNRAGIDWQFPTLPSSISTFDELEGDLKESKQRLQDHQDPAQYNNECSDIFNSYGFNWQFPTLP